MGGLGVVVDWNRSVTPIDLEPMISLIPHRARGRIERTDFDHAVIAETRLRSIPDPPNVTTVGDLAIVGDIRLWNRDGLRGRAGGHTATSAMTDRRLLLEAYRRTGIGFLDDVDGDFAFIIWDDEAQRVIAVRDRFGMKPLFFERTPTGMRFASEPKQLAATSQRPIEPNARSIAEYVTGHFQETRFTFFEGMERVRPATALIVDPSGERVHRYWDPSTHTVPPPPADDIANEFRDRLADSVRRRLDGTNGAVGHLSGGLDSTAIAAAAHVLADQDHLPAPFHTVSAVFPGYEIDESVWIDEIAAMQPFPHHGFIPGIDDIEKFEADMWIADQPRVNRIRDMWSETATIAQANDADLVFNGIGGDQILDQGQLLIDRIRSGSLQQRLRDARAYAAWTGGSLVDVADPVLRDALPDEFKRTIRGLLPKWGSSARTLIRPELWKSLASEPIEFAPFEFDFPSLTQVGAIASTQHPSIAWINEAQEAVYASRGLDLSQPYLDRTVVEYVASLSPARRPFDGRSKILVRNGFSDWLPPSVLERRTKTVADDYLDVLFALHGTHLRDRYPGVSDAALDYLDDGRYVELLNATNIEHPGSLNRESLWSAWMLMAWFDGLTRYRQSPWNTRVP